LLTLSLLTLSLLTLSLLSLALLSSALLTLALLSLSLLPLSFLTLALLTLSLRSFFTMPLSGLLAGLFSRLILLSALSAGLLSLLTSLAWLCCPGGWLIAGLGLALLARLALFSGLAGLGWLALAPRSLALGVRVGPGLGVGRVVPSGELAVDLIRQVFEFGLGSLEGGGLVAQDAPGGLLDAFSELADPLASLAGGPGGFLVDADLGQLLGLLQGVGDGLLVGLVDGLEKLLGQERLGLLGLLDGLAHPLQEGVELLLLAFEPLLDLLAIVGVA
jgi:hypothetical protein